MDTYPGEAIYLWLFDDVRRAVEAGVMASGEAHFQQCGQREIAQGARKLPIRRRLSFNWLRGQGIEIGALHNPLAIYPGQARVTYVDRFDEATLRQHYPELAGEALVPVGIIDDGERLASIPDDSQDFLIANHVIEHTEDPIASLQTWFRVVRPGGMVYLGVPDKRHTFDRERVNTPWLHVLADHRFGAEGTRRQHYEEWVRYVGHHSQPEVVEAQVTRLLAQRYSIHFHVWDAEQFSDFLVRYREQFNPDFVLRQYEFNPDHMEMIFVLEKVRPEASGV
ncbi:MAG: methyltransferase domain-containing protein [Pseudomonadota bacterium]